MEELENSFMFDPFKDTSIHKTKTIYHQIFVNEEDGMRKLIFGSGIAREQSAILLDDINYHVYDYSLMAMQSMLFVNNTFDSNILIVGLGGGVIPRSLSILYPHAKIDVIEIDPEVVKIAKEYFYFTESDNVKAHIGDAYNMIQKLDNKYDVVILDAFTTSYTPIHLMSMEFITLLNNILKDNSIIAMNVFTGHQLFKSQLKTAITAFGDNIYKLNGSRNHNATMLYILKGNNKESWCESDSYVPKRMIMTDDIRNAELIKIFKEK
jgi:spermidine synthase